MGAEISEIGEFALYILYILLAILIVAFIYVIRKKKLSIDVDNEKKYSIIRTNHYKVDTNLLKKVKEQSTNLSSEVTQKTKKDITKTLKEDIKKDIFQDTITKIVSNKLPIYRNDMPILENVKPSDFEYFKGNKLLIVEDNKINQKILLNVLKNINTPIDIANNGEEAIKKVLEEKNKYDLILMDISMPVMDGINATKNIRQDSSCDDIPIITVTAFTSGLEIGQMFEAGANAFLTKPLDINKLFVAMLLYLDNSKSDLSIQKEFEIIGIDLDEVVKPMEVEQDTIKETITEFLDKFSSLEYHIPQVIDDNNLKEARTLLDELDMILDLIGATRMQKFIEEMRISLDSAENIEYYKVLFIAQYKALLNSYKKYINSL
jgi:CheY-like chemotaxis protein